VPVGARKFIKLGSRENTTFKKGNASANQSAKLVSRKGSKEISQK
jgi:hypothetical protein